MTTRFIGHLLTGTHAGRPAASAVPEGTLYSCTTHSLMYQSDTATWATWATLSGTGIADQGTFTYLDATEAAAPGTPASGKARIYAKADGRIYSKDDAGVEYGPFDVTGGAGGPLLYADSLALHANGDEFSDATLAAWTLGGALTTGDVSAVTTEPYDATCLDVVFGAQSDRMLRSIPSWTTISLTIHGITNSTPSSLAASGGMIGLCVVDSSGNGTGFALYNDGGMYLWGVTAYAYSASGPGAPGTWSATPNAGPAASNMPIVLRLRKSGTSIYGGLSFNGGLSFSESTARTDAATHDRFGIIRLYSGGGTDPTLRIGRINVVT